MHRYKERSRVSLFKEGKPPRGGEEQGIFFVLLLWGFPFFKQYNAEELSKCERRWCLQKRPKPLRSFYLSKFLYFQQIPSLKPKSINISHQKIHVSGISIMCIGLEKSHFQCGHADNFVITAQCENALATRKDCTQAQCSFIEEMIDSPHLCVDCYRSTEKWICDEAYKKRHKILEDLENDRQKLENPDLPEKEWVALETRTEKLTKLLYENRKECRSALKEFRKSQGVWVDGLTVSSLQSNVSKL